MAWIYLVIQIISALLEQNISRKRRGYKNAIKILQECYNNAMRMLQERYKNVTEFEFKVSNNEEYEVDGIRDSVGFGILRLSRQYGFCKGVRSRPPTGDLPPWYSEALENLCWQFDTVKT